MSTDTATLASPTFTLEEVVAHFEHWRRKKKKRGADSRAVVVGGNRCGERLWVVASHAPAAPQRSGSEQTARNCLAAADDGRGVPRRLQRSSNLRLRWLCKRSAGSPHRVVWSSSAPTGCGCASSPVRGSMRAPCSSASWGWDDVAADPAKPRLRRHRAGGFPPRHRWAGGAVPATAGGRPLHRGDLRLPQPSPYWPEAVVLRRPRLLAVSETPLPRPPELVAQFGAGERQQF